MDEQSEVPVETEEEKKEFERLLTWFIKNNRRVAWSKGLEELHLVEGELIGKTPNNQFVRVPTKGKKKK